MSGCEEVPFTREKSEGQGVVYMGIKGLIMLFQEKQLANNNYWAASACRTWNPASWNDHKTIDDLALPLRSKTRAGPPEQSHVCDKGGKHTTSEESPWQTMWPGQEGKLEELALSRDL